MSEEKEAVEVQEVPTDEVVATRETSVTDMSPEELQAAFEASMTTEEPSDETGETADASVESQGESENGETEKPVEAKAAPSLDELTVLISELRKKQENLELAYQRGQEELGQHRKWRREFLERQLQQANQKPTDYAENSDFYGEKAPARNEFGDHVRETRKELWELAELEAAEQAAKNQKQVHQLVPDFAEQLDTIVDLIRSFSGNSPNVETAVGKFRQNPYLETPQTLVFAALAAKERKKAREAELRAQEIEKRLNELSNSRTQKVRSVQAATRGQPKVGASSGQASTKASGLSKPIHEMSLAELEKEYAKLKP